MIEAADLYLIGCGILPARDVTIEALSILSQVVSYTTLPSPNLRSFLESNRLDFVNIEHLYETGKERSKIYADVAAHVLEKAARERPIAYLTYGHPMYLDEPVRLMLAGAAASGLRTRVVPGVSFVDSVIARLPLVVGPAGFQVISADPLVEGTASIDPSRPTLVAQIGSFRMPTANGERALAPALLAPLMDRLLGQYPADHRITFCDLDESGAEPLFLTVPLCAWSLAADGVNYATTMYIPPIDPANSGRDTAFETERLP
ncbi:SAM-dependent methyltransferase [Bradyrhizobium sp. CB82]|uniref:SAM-dependent methyltransferase n=1 Tax=Bradyrhizobium sp. CB82 TaxID=3039159 RepID=UPI0024B0DE06|nr:SAM-dependent methyltransferase [Bradyrhizobium sp. CB82]WFU40348.1 SAM-dependent methyltransferase [Bradyrhizobium sp. CB82]